MAVDDKGKGNVSDLSQESQRAMQDAQREGRSAVGFDFRPGEGGPSSGRTIGSNGSSLDRGTASGYNADGRRDDLERSQQPRSRGVDSPFNREGLSDESAERDDFDSLDDYAHGGDARRDDYEPLSKDKTSTPNNGYGGLYEGLLDDDQPSSGPMSVLGRDRGLDQQPTGEGETENPENPEGGAPGDKKPDDGPSDELSDQGGPEDDKKGSDEPSADEKKQDMDNASEAGKAAGMSDSDIDTAKQAAEGYNDKAKTGSTEDAINRQIDESTDKLAEDAAKEENAKKKSRKPGTSDDESSDKGEDKDKEKTDEEKAKDEGTAVAGGGIASNPNAMNQGVDPTGNGYKNPAQQSKMDEYNRRSLQHNQQMNNAANEDRPRLGQNNPESPGAKDVESKGPTEGKGKGETTKNGEGKAGAGKKKNFLGKAGNAINKAESAKEAMNNPFRWGKDRLKDALLKLMASHPMVIFAIIFGIFFIFVVFLLVLSSGGKGNNGGSSTFSGGGCNYNNLKGITTSGTVDLAGIQVELINCDGKENNYKVLEHIDFEKYVVGVALAEVSWNKYPEYFKSQIVAARGFALKRNSAMCPSRPDNCFYGYNAQTKTIRLRACTNDQVYCDYDKPCYRLVRSGQPALYGPEAAGMSGAYVWKNQLDEGTKSAILAAAEEVKGKVLVDSSGEVVYTNFINTDQQQWYAMAQQGMKWDEILIKHYSSSGASSFSSAQCANTGNIDYGNYSINSNGDTILNERLDGFLQKQGTSLDAFNALIDKNVKTAGYGTRAGVVAAAVTLIGELGDQYNIKVPYFLSGGHHDGVKVGAVGYWGGTNEDDGRRCYYTGYGNEYTICGLDCSGFVPWAIKTGGFNTGVRLAGDFQNISGAQKVTLSSSEAVLQPGDLLESEGHIVLVIGVDEGAKQYICAEASGKNAGVLFNRRSFTGGDGYWGVKMDGFYNNQANVRK